MPQRFAGKLCRFLFEHLDQRTFGEQLVWLDRRAGVFQLLWKHGNGSAHEPYRDCAVFMAWDQCKMRSHRCKPFEAKQRFRAAMTKMRLQTLKSWRAHQPLKGFQFRRFPKADLDYLLRNGKKTRGARRSRRGSVYSDCVSETECSDPTAAEALSTKLPMRMATVKTEEDITCNMAQMEDSKLAILPTMPEEFLASPQGYSASTEEVSEVYIDGRVGGGYSDDLGMDVAGEYDHINITRNGDEEIIICTCSRDDPQASRCLWCFLLELSDPPINPVFRFDVKTLPGTLLII